MTDAGSNNFSVGHRQWIMKPQQTVMGSGSTSNANTLYVVDPPSWRSALLPTDPTWAAWPTSGYFPSQLEPAGRWSLSTNSGVTDFAAATVTVTRHDVGNDVVMQPTVLTRSGSLLVWQFDPGFRSGFADRRYTVTVDNIVRDRGDHQSNL